MSRRHHGRPHHGRHRPDGARPQTGPDARSTATDGTDQDGRTGAAGGPAAPLAGNPRVLAGESIAKLAGGPPPTDAASVGPAPLSAPLAPDPSRDVGAPQPPIPVVPSPTPAASPLNGHGNGHAAPVAAQPDPSSDRPHAPGLPSNVNGHADRGSTCTAPQLRRFIKSRPYVPMHELRRRFGIDGADDDVTGVPMHDGHIYVGLPAREGSLLGELLRGGEIGYELSLDPRTPVVIGVYPMRPVPRG